jgi:hypothetical protein
MLRYSGRPKLRQTSSKRFKHTCAIPQHTVTMPKNNAPVAAVAAGTAMIFHERTVVFLSVFISTIIYTHKFPVSLTAKIIPLLRNIQLFLWCASTWNPSPQHRILSQSMSQTTTTMTRLLDFATHYRRKKQTNIQGRPPAPSGCGVRRVVWKYLNGILIMRNIKTFFSGCPVKNASTPLNARKMVFDWNLWGYRGH